MSAIELSWISDTDGGNKVYFVPSDNSPMPDIKRDVYLSGSPATWDGNTPIPPLYSISDPGSYENGAQLSVSGRNMSKADKNKIREKTKAGIAQLYYDVIEEETYTVYLYPLPQFKRIEGARVYDFTIHMTIA